MLGMGGGDVDGVDVGIREQRLVAAVRRDVGTVADEPRGRVCRATADRGQHGGVGGGYGVSERTRDTAGGEDSPADGHPGARVMAHSVNVRANSSGSAPCIECPMSGKGR